MASVSWAWRHIGPQFLLLGIPPAERRERESEAMPPSTHFSPRLPLAVAKQDHAFGGAKKIERGRCLQVTCQRTHKKTGRCAHYLLENEPIFRLPPSPYSTGLFQCGIHGRPVFNGLLSVVYVLRTSKFPLRRYPRRNGPCQHQVG
jgi:hypothetical protein